jgi:hypothetical protein
VVASVETGEGIFHMFEFMPIVPSVARVLMAVFGNSTLFHGAPLWLEMEVYKGCATDISFNKPAVRPLDLSLEASCCATCSGSLILSLFFNHRGDG